MSWISLLYETYENVMKGDTDELNPPLLPIAHTTQNADVEVLISISGEFIGSNVVEGDKQTIIPCSETSAGRAGSNPANHPLFDKLQYLAGDYTEYGGEKGDHFHKKYMDDLHEWCNSHYSNEQVKAIYKYLKKGTLIKDLVRDGTIICDNSGKIMEKWTGSKSETPLIFKTVIGEQSNAFIRFSVSGGSDSVTAAWQNKKVQQDYINYYLSKQKNKAFCYVTGEMIPCSDNHPSKIRNTGDKAKIISANDYSGFTFRGRFSDSKQAVQVGYDVSQKAHNALKWLIQKQGTAFGDKVFLLWGTNNEDMPCLTNDTVDFCNDESINFAYTKEEIAERFNKAIAGYNAQINSNTNLALIGLDSATTGRLSIIFYREFHGKQGNELFANIENWHNSCKWHHRFKFKNEKRIAFDGAPSPEDIALISYGTEQNGRLKADEKLIGATVERLLPCISDGAKLPQDIVRASVNKCFHPQNYKESYNWDKVLTVTCSLVRKNLLDYNDKGVIWDMELKENCRELDYNCGRMLAVADWIEKWALDESDEKRSTNAIRLFSKFSQNPCETWKIIREKLTYYEQKLGSKVKKYSTMLAEISALIDQEEFKKAKNLSGLMALGFDSQRNYIYNSLKKPDEKLEKNSGGN